LGDLFTHYLRGQQRSATARMASDSIGRAELLVEAPAEKRRKTTKNDEKQRKTAKNNASA
jgi:hypothetical protein